MSTPGREDYRRLLRRRRRTLLACTLAGALLGAAVVAVLGTSYQASALILVEQRVGTQLVDSEQRLDIDTEMELLRSTAVEDLVEERLGFEPVVVVNRVRLTQLIEVRANGETRDEAVRVAEVYVNAFVEVRRTQVLEALTTVREELRKKVTQLSRTTATGSAAGSAATVAELAAAAQLSGLPLDQSELARLQLALGQVAPGSASGGDDVAGVVQLLRRSAFEQIIDRIDVTADYARAAGPRLLATPERPKGPAQAPWWLVVPAFASLGLLAGVLLVFVAAALDRKLRTAGEAATAVRAPVLAALASRPSDALRDRAGQDLRDALLRHPSHVLLLAAADGATPADDLGQLAGSTGRALQRAGRRVILLDLRPSADAEIGFYSVLDGSTTLEHAIADPAGADGVALLPAGLVPDDVGSVLLPGALAGILSDLRQRFDHVLLVPPPGEDRVAALVAPHAQAAVLLVTLGRTEEAALGRAAASVRAAGAPLIGLVLADAAPEDAMTPLAGAPADAEPAPAFATR